jgi:predicted ATPase
VLIGAETRALTRDAVDVEAVEPLSLKGKTEPVPAFRLMRAGGELARRFATPMVGRETELRRLRDAFAQAVHDRSCQLFTVLGSAGVGKSRFGGGVPRRHRGAGRAGRLPVLRRGDHLLAGGRDRQATQYAARKRCSRAASLAARRDGVRYLGRGDRWGFRKLLEQEAQERPLVCLLDDMHWAEQTLLDLVEHIADSPATRRSCCFCMARPELLEKPPTWGGGKWNATVLLEPLDAAETERLLDELGGVEPGLRERIATAAEGNPLFLEEMLALAHASDDGEISVLPTIQALLAARLDQLDPAERAVFERGSVEGRVFHKSPV